MPNGGTVAGYGMPKLRCAGCGAEVSALSDAGVAWRCPRAGEGDVDHVLRPVPDEDLGAWGRGGLGPTPLVVSAPDPHVPKSSKPSPAEWPRASVGASVNPFLRYRHRLGVYAAARALGMSDAEFVSRVERLDERVAEVDGGGFQTTPLRIESVLAPSVGLPCGNLLVKVEADNVSGSHKARHLMGIALWLDVEAWTREHGALPSQASAAPRLAIASCGNAALAAAVVARAAGRDLDVFVPTWASPSVVARLRALGASISACERAPGVAGDPCYHGFREAVARGATPFCCQGPDNALTIEGGETLAWEMVDALEGDVPDAVFVQVGGGALATSVARGLLDAHRAGHIARLPRLHAVQTYGCAPLARAYDAVVVHILRGMGEEAAPLETLATASARARIDRARVIAARAPRALVDEALRFAATHRSAFMRPWETEPHSLATGILDDETYDWLAIVEAMLGSGGYPVLATEDALALANRLARDVTDVDVCMTGTAGLAGLMDAVPLDDRLARERVGVVFSGRRR